MKKLFFGFAILSVLSLSTLFVSCEQNELLDNSEAINEYVDEAIFEIESRGNTGRFGCNEFVFPITLNFPDETSVEIEDYDDLKSTLRTWKEENPEAEERPVLAFPLEVTTEEGEVVSIESLQELEALRAECRRDFFDCLRDRECRRDHRDRAERCFKFVFPLSISFPNGDVLEVEGPREMKKALRDFRRENRGSEERPSLVFPLQVELLENETAVEVADKEALMALKEECRGN